MSKKVDNFIEEHFITIILVGLYLTFCAWWQWYFVMPFIRIKDYDGAFNLIFGINPLVPIIFWSIYYFLKKVIGVIYYLKIKLFGE